MSQNIKISYHSGIYTLTAEQILETGINEAWDFFSSPENLEKITPSKMNFRITSGKPEKMYAGQIISYKIKIFPFFSSHWVTEITQVENLSFFIDEQRFGPYKMWHHEHRFKSENNTIGMHDKVTYKIPFGFLGRFAHFLFIRKKLESIFTFRAKLLSEKFNLK